jgi:hypothetical protein
MAENACPVLAALLQSSELVGREQSQSIGGHIGSLLYYLTTCGIAFIQPRILGEGKQLPIDFFSSFLPPFLV